VTAVARDILAVFKLRIGVAIMASALAGLAMSPAPAPEGWRIVALALAVLVSAAAAGAFNQYLERDLDRLMARTRRRPFATGTLAAGPLWPLAIAALLVAAVGLAAVALNAVAAAFVFLGAFFYGVVYTVWLKRRTWANIVVGGASGSFAVLAGAAAADPSLGPAPLVLAVVLFLWTPPHFWSLAAALCDDYRAAGVPMLPVVAGAQAAAWVILAHTVVLVGLSLVPAFYGMGWLYLAAAVVGGVIFLRTSIVLAAAPSRRRAMANFHASLAQLGLLLAGAMADRWLAG